MPDRVIRGRKVENDVWQVIGLAPHEDLSLALPEGPVLVPLAYWTSHREELAARRQPVGVWLAPEDDPVAIADDLGHLSAVAVHFPKVGDGRGYSTAVLLRTRHGYRGELRAFGDLGRDQLFFLARVGFDSFKLAPGHDPEAALAAFTDFTVRYQGSVDDPVPLFRKRAVAGGIPR
jgi:uncharacterized protein (DUF934 family)